MVEGQDGLKGRDWIRAWFESGFVSRFVGSGDGDLMASWGSLDVQLEVEEKEIRKVLPYTDDACDPVREGVI